MWVSLQKQFLIQFKEPYFEAFKFINKFGHRLKWNKDIEDFVKQLDRVITKESKYQVELDKKQKQLLEYRKSKGEETVNVKQNREQFITLLNTLGKLGYKIDKNETTIEELALMLKQQYDEQEKLNFSHG